MQKILNPKAKEKKVVGLYIYTDDLNIWLTSIYACVKGIEGGQQGQCEETKCAWRSRQKANTKKALVMSTTFLSLIFFSLILWFFTTRWVESHKYIGKVHS